MAIITQTRIFKESQHATLQTNINQWISDNYSNAQIIITGIEYTISQIVLPTSEGTPQSTEEIYSALVYFTVESNNIVSLTDAISSTSTEENV